MRNKLSDLEIQRALGRLGGWSRRGDVLVKSYTFASFSDSVAFVNRVAKTAGEIRDRKFNIGPKADADGKGRCPTCDFVGICGQKEAVTHKKAKPGAW